jgi:hypothetical protein
LRDVGCTVEMKIEITRIFSIVLKDEKLKIELKGMNGISLLIDILGINKKHFFLVSYKKGSSANEKLQEFTSSCIHTLVTGSEDLKKEVGDTVITPMHLRSDIQGTAALVIYLSSQNNHILDAITSTLIEISEIESCVKNMIDYGATSALVALITPPAVTRINTPVLFNVLKLLVTLSKTKNGCDLIATHGNNALP